MTGSDAVSKTFAALAEPRRRAILGHFVERGNATASYEELLQAVLEDADALDCRSSASIQLRHVDLPTLAACNVVEHDARSETVRYVDSPLVEHVLDGDTDVARTC